MSQPILAWLDDIDGGQVAFRSHVTSYYIFVALDDGGAPKGAFAITQAANHNWLSRRLSRKPFCGVCTMGKSEIYIFGFRGFPDVQGGIETHVENLAPQLVRIGHRVTACVRSPYVDKQCKEWKGVQLLRLWTVRNAYFETLLHSLICVLVAG